MKMAFHYGNPKLMFLSVMAISSISILELGAKADEQLMIRECHNADVPTTCMQCLESDPTSLQADSVGIARIIVNCLGTHLDLLSKNISSIASEKQERSIKPTLEDCKKSLSETEKDLSEAQNGLNTGKYDSAGHYVREGLENPLSCKFNLENLQFQDSPDIYFQIKIYEELSDAAMRIIDRL